MPITQCSACHGKKNCKVLVRVWGGRGPKYRMEKCSMCRGKGVLQVRRGRGLRW